MKKKNRVLSDSEEEEDGIKATKKIKHGITDSDNEVDDDVTKVKKDGDEQKEEGEVAGNKEFQDTVQENEDSDDEIIADGGL